MIVQSSQIVPLFDLSSFNTVGTPGSKDHLVELVKRNISYLGKIAFASKTKQVRTQALRRLQAHTRTRLHGACKATQCQDQSRSSSLRQLRPLRQTFSPDRTQKR